MWAGANFSFGLLAPPCPPTPPCLACLGADVLQQLSGCKVVPYDVLNSTFGDPACANWATKTYVLEPCPPACDFQGLPSECLNSVAQWMVVTSKGLAPNATLPNFV